MGKYKSPIVGNLDIFVDEKEGEFEGKTEKWRDILIHGDPEGLRSLASVLLNMADINQNEIGDLPTGAREHIHLRPKFDLSNSSEQLIVGRLDAKGTGGFYARYLPKRPD